jgi:hypothetical protein
MEFVIFAKWNYCEVSRHIHIGLDVELLTCWKKVPKPFCSLLKVPLYDIIYIFFNFKFEVFKNANTDNSLNNENNGKKLFGILKFRGGLSIEANFIIK